MKRLLLLILLLLPGHAWATIVVTDSFTGSDGTNLTAYSANWTANASIMVIKSNGFRPNGGASTHVLYSRNDVSPGPNQYAQTTCGTQDDSNYIGPAVRIAAATADGYFFHCGNAGCYYGKAVSGVYTDFNGTSLGTAASGDVLKITAIGTKISVYKNGTLLASTTDSTFSSGRVGIKGFGAANGFDDNFEGGELINFTNILNEVKDNDASAYTSTTFNVSDGVLLLASVFTMNGASVGTPTLTDTGLGLTWVQIATVTNAGATRRNTLFRAYAVTGGSGITISSDYGGNTQTKNCWRVSQVTGTSTSGTSGSGAIVQSKTGTDNAGGGTHTYSITLNSSVGSNTMTFGSQSQDGSNLIDPGANYTELAEGGSATAPSSRGHSEYSTNGANATIDWSSNTAEAEMIGVEITPPGGGGGALIPVLSAVE